MYYENKLIPKMFGRVLGDMGEDKPNVELEMCLEILCKPCLHVNPSDTLPKKIHQGRPIDYCTVHISMRLCTNRQHYRTYQEMVQCWHQALRKKEAAKQYLKEVQEEFDDYEIGIIEVIGPATYTHFLNMYMGALRDKSRPRSVSDTFPYCYSLLVCEPLSLGDRSMAHALTPNPRSQRRIVRTTGSRQLQQPGRASQLLMASGPSGSPEQHWCYPLATSRGIINRLIAVSEDSKPK
ncbi:hypothetical protein L210DRAFT_3504742 [Boletus edulis BED1]|uniref:Uncharacterized protein n=1 Tax=Boletus edulis BED1 TaxID=1328754 RepID=A0AAD4BTP7_BOLED|nr:hypothetical protein L210DRAFT_3504742 [Boletus edulis BED1]